MDIAKLKIDKFKECLALNFQNQELSEMSSNDPEVVIYYIDALEDVKKFTTYVEKANLPKDNRVIMVYKKGRKDGVNRDSIIGPFRSGEIKGFKIKQPALCSLSKEYSAFVQLYEVK